MFNLKICGGRLITFNSTLDKCGLTCRKVEKKFNRWWFDFKRFETPSSVNYSKLLPKSLNIHLV